MNKNDFLTHWNHKPSNCISTERRHAHTHRTRRHYECTANGFFNLLCSAMYWKEIHFVPILF